MKKNISFLILLIFFGLAWGCSPNERVFYKDNIACSASNRGTDEWQYYRVEIGNPDNVYKGGPVLDISIRGVGKFQSDAVPLKSIKGSNEIEVQEIYPTETTPQVGQWPASVTKIMCGPYLSFVVDGDRILQILIVHKGKLRISGTEKWYKIPCTEDEIIEIFGEPDRTYEWFRE